MNDLVPERPQIPPPQNPDSTSRGEIYHAVVDVLRSFTLNGRPLGIQGSNIQVDVSPTGTTPFQPYVSITPLTVPRQLQDQKWGPVDQMDQRGPQAPDMSHALRDPEHTSEVVRHPRPQHHSREIPRSRSFEPQPQPDTTVDITVDHPQGKDSEPKSPGQTLNHGGPIQFLLVQDAQLVYVLVTAQLNGQP